MGWSWALFLAHSMLVAIMDHARGDHGQQSRLVYGHPAPQLASPLHQQSFDTLNWAYMDDYGAVCSTGSVAEQKSDWETITASGGRIKKALTSRGFPVHKEDQREGILSLGAECTTRPYSIAAVRKKTILIVLATAHILRLRVVPIKSVEKLVGLWG